MSDIKTFKLYDGDVTLEFNERAPAYRYRVNGEYVPGVTTIVDILNKPYLMTWPMNEFIKYVKTNCKSQLGDDVSETDIYVLSEGDVEDASKAYVRKSDRGKDTGTIAHSLVQTYILSPSMARRNFKKSHEEEFKNKEIDNAFHNFLLFWNHLRPETVFSERPVYSKELGYSGTLDWFGTVGSTYHIIDWKTNNASPYKSKKGLTFPTGIYKEAFIQTGGYSRALKEEFEDYKDIHQTIVNLAKHKKFDNVEDFMQNHVRTVEPEKGLFHEEAFANATRLRNAVVDVEYKMKKGEYLWAKD